MSQRIALLTTFAASKKEPLVAMLDRVRQAFLDAGVGEPDIRFAFGDAPVLGTTSSVDRVLKRHPELARFVTDAAPAPGLPSVRRISNGPLSPAAGETIPYQPLQAIAAGVPRSFPFHSVVVQFAAEAFGAATAVLPRSAELVPGVLVTDSWWVSGRQRSLSACTLVDADPSAKKLPPLPAQVAQVLAACGKVKKTVQAPLPLQGAAAPADAAPTSAAPSAATPTETLQAVKQIQADYRARMGDIVARAALPHDLPPLQEVLRANLGVTAGPRKPALDAAFGPMGYSCKGGSGTFTLKRRTKANLTVELMLDVGTWSHMVTAIYKVLGLGFATTLRLPVTARAMAAGQYPIGDAEQWGKIVANLAALVAELDRSFVPEIERAAGPSPAWYQPES